MRPFNVLSGILWFIIAIYSLYQAWKSFHFRTKIQFPTEYLSNWISKTMGKDQKKEYFWDYKQRGTLFILSSIVSILAALYFIIPQNGNIFTIDLSQWDLSNSIKVVIFAAIYFSYIVMMIKKRLLGYLLLGLVIGMIGSISLYHDISIEKPIAMAIISAVNFFIPVTIGLPIGIYFFMKSYRNRRKFKKQSSEKEISS